MKDLVKNVVSLDIDEIDSYDFPLDDVFGLEVINKGIKFCFIIKFSSNNKNLICCGSGAQNRSRRTSSGKLRTPPFFDRWSWYKYFDESFIVYADPVFFHDETITLGWYVGDKNQWYLETVSDIIEKLSKNQNILHDNILFYGSSGGGFASICLGTLIKGSKVLVNNSQFFILNYKKWHIGNLFNILYDEFSGLSKSDIIEKINYRLDVVELFKKCEYVPILHYYVNLESKRDVYDQCIPFIKEAKKLDFSDNLAVFLYREKSSEPHLPLPNDVTVDIIKSFSQTYLYNNEENSDNTSANNNLNNYNLLNNRISELKDQINVLRNDIFQNNDDDAAERNSFNLYKQELEQRLSEKEDLIYEKEKELIQKDNEITRMENLLTFKSKKLAEKENQINELLIKLTSR